MQTNLGKLADQLHAKRAEITAANAKVDELDAERRTLEARLESLMVEAGTTSVRGEFANATIVPFKKPKIADFAKLAAFVKRHGAIHLFERRISSTAWEELVESRKGKEIPGLEVYEGTRIHVTKLRSS